MDIVQILACVLLGIPALWISFRVMLSCWTTTCRSFYGKLLRYLIYPRIFPQWHHINPSRLDLLLHVTHWAFTGFCNVYNVRSVTEAGLRAGSIAVVHLVLLIAAPQLNFGADVLGLSLAVFYRVHRAFGIMATAQGVFHSAVYLRSASISTFSGSLSLTVDILRQPLRATD